MVKSVASAGVIRGSIIGGFLALAIQQILLEAGISVGVELFILCVTMCAVLCWGKDWANKQDLPKPYFIYSVLIISDKNPHTESMLHYLICQEANTKGVEIVHVDMIPQGDGLYVASVIVKEQID